MPPYRPTQQKTPWISPAERRRTAALQDAAARTDASILSKLGKPLRGDIFVASAMENEFKLRQERNMSPRRAWGIGWHG